MPSYIAYHVARPDVGHLDAGVSINWLEQSDVRHVVALGVTIKVTHTQISLLVAPTFGRLSRVPVFFARICSASEHELTP